MSRLSRSRAVVATGLTLGTTAAALAFTAPSALAESTLPALSMPGTAAPGATITVSGTGCFRPADGDFIEGSDVEVMLAADTDGDDYYDIYGGSLVAPNGTWSAKLAFPADTRLGPVEIDASCDIYGADELYPVATVTVAKPSTTPPSTPAGSTPVATQLATTGGEVGAVLGEAANTAGTKSITTDKTTGATSAPGKKVVKVIGGFQPWEKVTLVLHSTPVTIGEFTADGNGVLTAEFTLPAGIPAGSHTLVFDGTVTYYQEGLTVTAAGTSASGSLAYTGASVALPLALGGALVVAGGGALLVSRRRAAGTQA
jgi:Rieske Fe-S protein